MGANPGNGLRVCASGPGASDESRRTL